MIVRRSQLVVCIQGKEHNNNIINKRKVLRPTDGNTSYIAGWTLTLKPDGNAFFQQSAVLNH